MVKMQICITNIYPTELRMVVFSDAKLTESVYELGQQYNTMQTSLQYNTMQRNLTQLNATQLNATQRNAT